MVSYEGGKILIAKFILFGHFGQFFSNFPEMNPLAVLQRFFLYFNGVCFYLSFCYTNYNDQTTGAASIDKGHSFVSNQVGLR